MSVENKSEIPLTAIQDQYVSILEDGSIDINIEDDYAVEG